MSLTNTIIESTSTFSGYGGVFTGSNLVIIIISAMAIFGYIVYKITAMLITHRHKKEMECINSPHFCKPCQTWMKPQLGVIPHTNIHRQFFECPKCGFISN